jgi:hypothetical protein
MKYKLLKFTYTVLHYLTFILSAIFSIYILEYFEINNKGLFSWILLILSWLIVFSILNMMLLKKLLFKGFIKENTPKFWYDDNMGYFGWPDEIQAWKWIDVVSIEIVTTDEGPWNEDLYWLISVKNRNECIVIPQGAEGGNAMLDAIPKVLGEPDWAVATEAMCCCSDNRFLIWSHGSAPSVVIDNVG